MPLRYLYFRMLCFRILLCLISDLVPVFVCIVFKAGFMFSEVLEDCVFTGRVRILALAIVVFLTDASTFLIQLDVFLVAYT